MIEDSIRVYYQESTDSNLLYISSVGFGAFALLCLVKGLKARKKKSEGGDGVDN